MLEAVLGIVLAALAAVQPREYQGPRDAAAPVEPVEAIEPIQSIDPTNRAHRGSLVEPAPQPPRVAVRSFDQITNPTGRGLLIAGGVLAASGLALASAATALRFRPCSGCIDPPFGAMTTSLLAPIATIASLPFLGVGIQRRRYDRIARGLAVARAPRRGVLATGVVMASVASAGMIAAWPFDPINLVALWVGPPIAIAGVLMAGAARGRRLAHASVVPIVTGRLSGVAVAGRW